MASDVEAEDREEQPFAAGRAKTGRAKCKKCKQAIEKGEIRIAKYVTSFYADGKLMPAWHHVACLFEVFAKQRATTRRIDEPERDVKGWELLADEERQLILERLRELDKSCPAKNDPKETATPRKVPSEFSGETTKEDSDGKSRQPATKKKDTDDRSDKKKREEESRVKKEKAPSKDNSFHEFQRICSNIADVDAYTDKTAIIKSMFTRGAQGEAYISVEMAVRKCPNGMLSEIKYDGERVQVHKSGGEFRYFSRSLKPVMPHKVNLFKDYIVRAFPDGDDLILDSEVLMVDNETGCPLPFGTLGIHKKAEFKNANVCLFAFDCLYYNGEILMNKPMSERRKILRNRITEIPNRIMLSEVHEVNDPRDLAKMIVKVLKQGLEGLVLKDLNNKYEPGKRHWLKVKKDYLCGGAMADSADLVVLGAWYGTGNKGGMLSIFLMGCYDKERDRWLTVTKVHTEHDDATLAALQNELDMVKIGKDKDKLPNWLHANKPMVPDFVVRDPNVIDELTH